MNRRSDRQRRSPLAFPFVALQQRASSGPVNESIGAGLGGPLLDPDGSSHATSHRLTAAPMNRRAGRALAPGLAEDV